MNLQSSQNIFELQQEIVPDVFSFFSWDFSSFFYYIHHKSVLEHTWQSKPELLEFPMLPQGVASTIK